MPVYKSVHHIARLQRRIRAILPEQSDSLRVRALLDAYHALSKDAQTLLSALQGKAYTFTAAMYKRILEEGEDVC